MWRLTAGWVMCRVRAAAVNEPSRTTSLSDSSWRSSMAPIPVA